MSTRGPIGGQGNSGERGEAGDRGATGEQGPKGDLGQEGDSGERGQSGDRGVSGERGPKGDHGQEGHDGERGPAGAQGEQGEHAAPPITRRLASILAVVLTVGFMGLIWVTDHNSCLRQKDVRVSARIFSESAAKAREASAVDYRKRGDLVQARINEKAATEFRRAWKLTRSLDCSGLFPDK